MKRPLALALVVGLGTQVAAADDAAKRSAALKKLLDAQATALVQGDKGEEAYKKTLAADPLDDQQHDLMGPAKIKLGAPKVGWLGTCGWVAAEAQVRIYNHPEGMVYGQSPISSEVRTWHWLELVVPDGTEYKAKAVAMFVTTPDKNLANGQMNEIKTYATEKSPTPLVAWLAQPAEMAKHLSKDPAVAVYGTSANDRAYGPTAAKKLLGSWAKLKLDIINKPDTYGYQPQQVVAGDCAAASSKVRMQIKGGAILLDAFAIAHKVGDQWELLALAYATNDTY